MLWSMYFFLIWFILICSLIVTIKLRLNYLNYEEMFFVRGFIFICNYSNYKNWVFKSFQKFYEVLDFLSKVFFGVIIFESFLFYCVHKKVYPQWILFGNFHTGVSLFFGIFKILKRKCKSWRFFASQIFFLLFLSRRLVDNNHSLVSITFSFLINVFLVAFSCFVLLRKQKEVEMLEALIISFYIFIRLTKFWVMVTILQ